jgi:hypothetical protein
MIAHTPQVMGQAQTGVLASTKLRLQGLRQAIGGRAGNQRRRTAGIVGAQLACLPGLTTLQCSLALHITAISVIWRSAAFPRSLVCEPDG